MLKKIIFLIIALSVCSCVLNKQIKEIPDMMIEYGDGLDNPLLNTSSAYVKHGTASWMYYIIGNKKGGFIADGLHPLDENYYNFMPKLEKTDKIKISISYPPDYYTVKYWSEDYIGDYDKFKQYEQNYQTLDVNDGIIILPNDGIGHVFLVNAIWESVNGIKDTQGYAYYSFFISGK